MIGKSSGEAIRKFRLVVVNSSLISSEDSVAHQELVNPINFVRFLILIGSELTPRGETLGWFPPLYQYPSLPLGNKINRACAKNCNMSSSSN